MNEIAAVQTALARLKSATDIVQILKASTTSLNDAEIKVLLQTVKRNRERFPEDFMSSSLLTSGAL
jgi:hypothetical protein